MQDNNADAGLASRVEKLQQRSDIDAAIDEIVSVAPALTDDQRNRISALLRTGSHGVK